VVFDLGIEALKEVRKRDLLLGSGGDVVLVQRLDRDHGFLIADGILLLGEPVRLLDGLARRGAGADLGHGLAREHAGNLPSFHILGNDGFLLAGGNGFVLRNLFLLVALGELDLHF